MDRPSTPLYKQVLQSLRSRIVDGTYAIGTTLPTEAELVAEFGVSRHTVREALRQLRTDGLLESKQGSGTTVTGAPSQQAFVHEVDTISDLIQYAASMTFSVESTRMLKPEGELATRLVGESDESWLCVEGARHANADGGLVCRTTVYVPARFAGVGRMVGRGNGAIYELIEGMYGVRIREVEQTVHARPAPPAAAKQMGLEVGAILIEVIRVYRLQNGAIAEVAVNLYPPERFTLTMKLRSKAR